MDADIEALHSAYSKMLSAPAPTDVGDLNRWLQQYSAPIVRFADALYATRYHERQFLFRLSRVAAEQHFDFRPPRGNVTIEVNDIPLRTELEAFLMRVTSSVDALCKLLCAFLGRAPRTYSPFLKLLKTDSDLQTAARQGLAARFGDAREWVDAARTLRNAIAHDSTLKGFRGVTHKGILVSDAEIGGVLAGGFAVRTWRDLLQLGHSCRTVLARPSHL